MKTKTKTFGNKYLANKLSNEFRGKFYPDVGSGFDEWVALGAEVLLTWAQKDELKFVLTGLLDSWGQPYGAWLDHFFVAYGKNPYGTENLVLVCWDPLSNSWEGFTYGNAQVIEALEHIDPSMARVCEEFLEDNGIL